MYGISRECYDALRQPSRRMTARANVTTSAGTVIPLTAADFKQGGIRLSEATSGAGSFDLGAAVIGKLTLTLNNSDGRFNGVHFIGGHVSSIQIGVILPDQSTEWIPLGIFDIESVKYSGTAAEVVAYDLLSRADIALPAVACPVTLGNLVRSICTHCGIIWSGQRFLHDEYTVEKMPESATCRDVISYAAALAGCYARMNRDGHLIFGWYGNQTPRWDSEAWLDGGIFTDMTSGDECDGGNFLDYSNGNTEGGRNDFRGFCVIGSPKNLAGDIPLTVTGISFTEPDEQHSALDEDGNEMVETLPGNTFLCGTEKYCFDLSGNPLLTHDIPDVLAALGDKLIGDTFHPVSISCPSHPALEAGDIVKASDRRGNTYTAFITRNEYKFGSPQRLSGEAKTSAEKSAENYSYVSRLGRRIKAEAAAELTAYGSRLQSLNDLMLHSMGVYKTSVQNTDGSVTTYAHDKPTLAASSYIACETAQGFAYTNSGWNEGSPVWQYGMSADGNILCNVLSTVGLIADWIQVGRIQSSDGSCYFDLDNDQLLASKIGLPTRYMSAGDVSTDTGESRAGIACFDSELSRNPYFQLRPVQSPTDSALYGFGLADQLGRVQIKCFSRAEDAETNGVRVYGYDAAGGQHELAGATAVAGGSWLCSLDQGSKVCVLDSGISLHHNGKSILAAAADHTYIRNPGSSPDYWISLDDNGIAFCKGSTVLQRWS